MKIIAIKLNKDFKRAYFKGKFKAHPILVTYMIKNRERRNRYGITASKKVGKAVYRNRARRLVREAYRELNAENVIKVSGYDFVFVTRPDILKLKCGDVKKIMKKQIEALQNGRA